MRIACMAFVSLIALVNIVAGMKQALALVRKRIKICNGVISRSRIGEAEEWQGHANKLRMYWADVEFEYQVSGRTKLGTRISMVSSKSSKRAEVEKQLSRYPEGRVVSVFYNADDFDEAYLKNPKKHIPTFLLIALGMLVFGGLMNFMIWKVVP